MEIADLRVTIDRFLKNFCIRLLLAAPFTFRGDAKVKFLSPFAEYFTPAAFMRQGDLRLRTII